MVSECVDVHGITGQELPVSAGTVSSEEHLNGDQECVRGCMHMYVWTLRWGGNIQ